jgi:hypothetical protein
MEEFWIIASEYFEKSDEWALHFLVMLSQKRRAAYAALLVDQLIIGERR